MLPGKYYIAFCPNSILSNLAFQPWESFKKYTDDLCKSLGPFNSCGRAAQVISVCKESNLIDCLLGCKTGGRWEQLSGDEAAQRQGHSARGKGLCLQPITLAFVLLSQPSLFSCCTSIQAKISFHFLRESLEENNEMLQTLCGRRRLFWKP